MTFPESPLFEPVLWESGAFKILDELQLPDKVAYIEARGVDDALAAVRDMKTRAFGQVLTYLYSGAWLSLRHRGDDRETLRRRLTQMTSQFCEARPTFDFRGLGAELLMRIEKTPPEALAGEWLAKQTCGFVRQIMEARRARARRAAEILPDVSRVLTHCNVSGELVVIAGYCSQLGKRLSVIATETRPYLQGTRLTAWELAEAGVPVSLIPDCAVAQVMERGDANAVIVGADRVAQNGDVINKVGTYPLAMMADAYGIPFYALVQDPGDVACGGDILIEERPASELLMFQGQRLADGDSLNARYPAFDVTPARYVTRWIGFDELYTLESFRRRFQTRSSVFGSKDNKSGKYLLIFGLPSESQLGFLKTAVAAEGATSLLVPEMRPELWGARVVAQRLVSRGVPVTLISDNMMGSLFDRGEIRQLHFFYNKLDQKGLEGTCGSLLAVRLAIAHGVPVQLQEAGAPGQEPLDVDVASFLGHRVIPSGVSLYPLHEETIPWDLLKRQRL